MEERERRRGSRDGDGEEGDEQSGVESDERETEEREVVFFLVFDRLPPTLN